MKENTHKLLKKIKKLSKEELNESGNYPTETVLNLWLNSFAVSLKFHQRTNKITIP
jgi:hypothetical protein